MAEAAEVVHAVPGRLRLRCPRLRGDAAELEALAAALEALPSVRQVRATPLTGSLLLLHETETAVLREALAPLLMLEEGHASPALGASIRSRLDDVVADVEAATDGSLDARGLAFLAFLGIALVQLGRGRVLMPAATALWYAFASLDRGADDATALDSEA